MVKNSVDQYLIGGIGIREIWDDLCLLLCDLGQIIEIIVVLCAPVSIHSLVLKSR